MDSYYDDERDGINEIWKRRKEEERKKKEEEETRKSNYKKMLDSPWVTKGMLSDYEKKMIQSNLNSLDNNLRKLRDEADAHVKKLKKEAESELPTTEDYKKREELRNAIHELQKQAFNYGDILSKIWDDKGLKTYKAKRAELEEKSKELKTLINELKQKETNYIPKKDEWYGAKVDAVFLADQYDEKFRNLEIQKNKILSILDDAYRESAVVKSNINKAANKFLKRSGSSGGKNRRKTKKKRRKKSRKRRRTKKKGRKRRRTKKKRRRRR